MALRSLAGVTGTAAPNSGTCGSGGPAAAPSSPCIRAKPSTPPGSAASRASDFTVWNRSSGRLGTSAPTAATSGSRAISAARTTGVRKAGSASEYSESWSA